MRKLIIALVLFSTLASMACAQMPRRKPTPQQMYQQLTAQIKGMQQEYKVRMTTIEASVDKLELLKIEITRNTKKFAKVLEERMKQVKAKLLEIEKAKNKKKAKRKRNPKATASAKIK